MPKGNLLNETESSLKALEEAEEHSDQGREYARQGAVAKAVSEYQAAIRLRDDHPDYYKELALLYEQQNEYKKAIKAWTDLLKYSSDPAEIEDAQKHLVNLRDKK